MGDGLSSPAPVRSRRERGCVDAGFVGADVLRRREGDEVAFVTLTRFRSIDDIRAFAGEPIDVPVIEPRAAELLARFDQRAMYYETASFAI